MRKELKGNESIISSLLLDVVDAVELARSSSRDARATITVVPKF